MTRHPDAPTEARVRSQNGHTCRKRNHDRLSPPGKEGEGKGEEENAGYA